MKKQAPGIIKPPRKGSFKLDLGCGIRKKEGFLGVDKIKFEGVDHVFDLTKKWPLADGSVDEVHCSHTIEHFNPRERCHFVNELYRVLVDEGTALIIAPHWSTCRAYGDPTHEWPPIGEFFFYYLDKEWRTAEAPHTDVKHLSWGFNCDFGCTWGYGLSPMILTRSQDFQSFAINYYREAVFDTHATLTKKKRDNKKK